MKTKQEKAAAELVSPEALQHLKSYKYQSVDKSFISRYILKHYWEWGVTLLPRWMAPNLVTLLGFMFIVVDVALVVAFIPDLVGPGPSWVYYAFAIGVWMYSTMDNLDGKQARRTGTSSPLGELFDHGIDSLNCTLASLCEVAAIGLGTSPAGVFTALVPCIPMYFSTWETYHTHVLYLGYINGPTEGLIIACVLMAASGYYGPAMWNTPIHYKIGMESLLGQATLRDAWVWILAGSVVIGHMPGCIINVVKARRRAGLPVAPVFLEWIPFLVFSFGSAAWLFSPYSILLKDNHLVLYCITVSFVFGRMTTKIILAHLTRQPFPMWTVLLVPIAFAAVVVNLPYFGLPQILSPGVELFYLRAYLVFAVAVYARWAHLVITSFCDFLGIKCLRIPHDKAYPPPPLGLNGSHVHSPKKARGYKGA